MQYAYPCILQPDQDHPSHYVVSFPDVPGALTQGEGLADALENAQEALEVILEDSMEDQEPIPIPGAAGPSQPLVIVNPTLAAKMALHETMRRHGMDPQDLADQLGQDLHTIQEMLHPRAATPLGQINRALMVLGRRLLVQDVEEHPATPTPNRTVRKSPTRNSSGASDATPWRTSSAGSSRTTPTSPTSTTTAS